MDFYYKCKKEHPKLVGTFRLSGITINFYKCDFGKFVIAKNRAILYESYNPERGRKQFLNAIAFEVGAPELFN